MQFLPPQIDAYTQAHTAPASALLDEIEAYTKAEVEMPCMLSGHLQGRVLAFVSKMIQPHRILEIGTYTGYSALCLCEGLAKGGELFTLDINADLAPRVRAFFESSVWPHQIHYLIGDARELIAQLPDPIDLVFIDADKESYTTYYELVLNKLSPGGVVIADNVLWGGKVIDPAHEQDSETSGLHTFNEQIQEDPRVENVLLPIRDGLMLLRKK